MERQEKKKRRICRRRRTKSKSSTTSLPQELISDILLRLPARSVLRFRCVSKLWLSIKTDPYFINLFETRFSKLMPSLLVCFKEGDKLFVSSIPQHRTLNESSQPIYRYHMEFPETSYLPHTESVHGLICFRNSATPIVWNPSKRQYLTLTKPRNSWNAITILLGYDPIEDKHKVMCIPLSRISDVCRVLTLGSDQETWRTVKINHKHRSDNHTSGRCIKGVIYYQACHHQCGWVIMSFDVRSEKFGRIDLPSDIRWNMLMNYEGRLACVNINKTWTSTLWILEDAKKHKWSSKDFTVPLSVFDESLSIRFHLKDFTHAGELIYVPFTFKKSYYVLFSDPVRRSYRRFESKGIADEESRPSNGYWYALHTFPNHI